MFFDLFTFHGRNVRSLRHIFEKKETTYDLCGRETTATETPQTTLVTAPRFFLIFTGDFHIPAHNHKESQL